MDRMPSLACSTVREIASAFDALVQRCGYSTGAHKETIAEAAGGLPLGRRGFLTLGPQVTAPKAPAVPPSVTSRVEQCASVLFERRWRGHLRLRHAQVDLI